MYVHVHCCTGVAGVLAIDYEMVMIKDADDRCKPALARCTIVNDKGEVVYTSHVQPERPVYRYLTRYMHVHVCTHFHVLILMLLKSVLVRKTPQHRTCVRG